MRSFLAMLSVVLAGSGHVLGMQVSNVVAWFQGVVVAGLAVMAALAATAILLERLLRHAQRTVDDWLPVAERFGELGVACRRLARAFHRALARWRQ
jgi:hypothetical protein